MNLQFLLTITPDQFNKPLDSWGDRISMSLEMLLRGMGTVFFVLALLWGILELFHVLAYRGKNKTKSAEPKKATPAPKKSSAPVTPAVSTPAPAQSGDDTALVAAITAAVAAYLEQSPTSFRVVSFKRTGKKK